MNDIDDLDVKIAKLQEEKARRLASAEKARREKEAEEARILIGSTPTKKKPRCRFASYCAYISGRCGSQF